ARLLRLVLRQLRGQVLVSWDGSLIHRGQPLKDVLRRAAARRRPLEPLPGDAPALPPPEGIGTDRARGALATVCCPDRPALALALRRAKERLRHQRAPIQPSMRQAGYHVEPFMQRSVIGKPFTPPLSWRSISSDVPALMLSPRGVEQEQSCVL